MGACERLRDVHIDSRAPRLTKTQQRDLEYEAIQNQIEELFQRVAQLERNDFERALEEDEKVCPFVDNGLCLGPAMVDTTLMVHQEVTDYPIDVLEDSFDSYVDLVGDPIFDTYDDEHEYGDSKPTQHSLFQKSVVDNQKDLSFFMEFEGLPKFWSDVFEVESEEAWSRQNIFFHQFWDKWSRKVDVESRLIFGGELKRTGLESYGRVIKFLTLQTWTFDPGGVVVGFFSQT